MEKRRNFKENLEDLINFCKENNRLPTNDFSKLETRLKSFLYNKRNRDNPILIEIRKKYKIKTIPFQDNLNSLIDFCKENNRLPRTCKNDKETKLRKFIYNHKNESEIILKLIEKYKLK